MNLKQQSKKASTQSHASVSRVFHSVKNKLKLEGQDIVEEGLNCNLGQSLNCRLNNLTIETGKNIQQKDASQKETLRYVVTNNIQKLKRSPLTRSTLKYVIL
jgi:hypothetical protein